MFKLARAREKKSRDLGYVRCIKSKDGRVLVEETKIRERWWSYFSRLLNGESASSRSLERGVQKRHLNVRPCSSICKEEVKGALKKMKSGKAVAPNLIPMEIWKCLGCLLYTSDAADE